MRTQKDKPQREPLREIRNVSSDKLCEAQSSWKVVWALQVCFFRCTSVLAIWTNPAGSGFVKLTYWNIWCIIDLLFCKSSNNRKVEVQGPCVPPHTYFSWTFCPLFCGCGWVRLGVPGCAWKLAIGIMALLSWRFTVHLASSGVSPPQLEHPPHTWGNAQECHTPPICSSHSHLPLAPQWSSLVSFCLMNILVCFWTRIQSRVSLHVGVVCLLFYSRIVPSLQLFLSINTEEGAVMSGRQGCWYFFSRFIFKVEVEQNS